MNEQERDREREDRGERERKTDIEGEYTTMRRKDEEPTGWRKTRDPL